MVLVVCAGLFSAAVGGCAASPSATSGSAAAGPDAVLTVTASAPTSAPSTAPTASSPNTGNYYAHDAVSVAALVPNCTGLHRLSASASRKTVAALAGAESAAVTITSAADCAVRGLPVVLLVFTDSQRQRQAESALAHVDVYVAVGAGWIAVPDPSPGLVQSDSAAQDFALALDGTLRLPRS